MTNLFEDYLQDVHADGYMGCDDDMPDHFSNWLCDLDGEELLKYGEEAIQYYLNKKQ
jgi:hypothetical protein